MMHRPRRPLVLLTIALLVGGFVGVNALRTTTTATSASDHDEGYRHSLAAARVAGVVEDGSVDRIEPQRVSVTITAVECSDGADRGVVVERRQGVDFCEAAPGAVAAELATRTVEGTERPVVVVTTELTLGGDPAVAERIELWLDPATGLPVNGLRPDDARHASPLGDAGYAEGYGWTETSLESID